MDFNLPGEDDPRRLEIRAWFEANPDASYPEMAERGLTAPNWPKPWGLGADPELQLIIYEEIERAGIKDPISVNMIALNQCGQSLLNHGPEDQRERFLPKALRCEERWCMLFSEPSGGSDIGGLRTTAVRDGDYYVINGQKTWNSNADKAQVGVVIARTDPSAPKHKGLTEFLIDMNDPGVEVRPIQDMTSEEHEYCEVFLTDVRVHVSNRLGDEGEGWKIVMEQLQSERATMTKPGAVWGKGPTARELMTGLIETGRIADPLTRDEAAKLFIEGEMLRLLTYRGLSNRINGRPAGLEGNAGKMVASPHGQRLSDLAKRTQGPAGMVYDPDVLPLPRKDYGLFDNWDYAYWFGPAATLGVGTQEILKNTVAERVLGLPREIDPSAKVPYNERSAAKLQAVG